MYGGGSGEDRRAKRRWKPSDGRANPPGGRGARTLPEILCMEGSHDGISIATDRQTDRQTANVTSFCLKFKLVYLTFLLIILSAATLTFSSNAAFAAIEPKEPIRAGDVYQISTKEELAWFRNAVNGGQTQIQGLLTADIDLGGEEWTPIGGKFNETINYFLGVFDGGGHTISGLNPTGVIVASGYDDYRAFGLFGCTGDSEIKNLTVSSDITASSDPDTPSYYIYAGLVMGYGNATITNCVSIGSVTATGSHTCSAGGIAGQANGDIYGCANLADVSASGAINTNYAGGIAGESSRGMFANCTNAASGSCTITAVSTDGTAAAGGIVGNNASGNISGSTNYAGGTVKASGNGSVSAGGIAADCSSLNSCANYGSVEAAGGTLPHAGGIAAEADSAANCTNYGNVKASSNSAKPIRAHAGGILAEHKGRDSDEPVENCKNSGNVTITTDADCEQNAGGIVGESGNRSTINSVENIGAVSANGTQAYVGGIVGTPGRNSNLADNVNSGAVTSSGSSPNVGSIAGKAPNSWTVSNCAGLEGTADNLVGGGTSMSDSEAKVLTQEQINNTVNSVAFDKTHCAVKEGETAELTLALSPNASAIFNEYASVTSAATDNSSTATATYRGNVITVTGVAEGETTLTVEVTLNPTDVTTMKQNNSQHQMALTCAVTVTKDGGVTLSESSLEFNASGAAQEITASAPSSLGTVLSWTWTSSNPSVATCEDLGGGVCRITPVGGGNATITVEALTASGRTWTASCAVTVAGEETPEPGPDPEPTPEPTPEHHGGSGGGCSAGWGALALLAIAPLFLRRGR